MIFFIAIICCSFLYYLYKLYSDYTVDKYYSELAKIDGIQYVTTPFRHLKISSPSICKTVYTKKLGLLYNLGLGDLLGRWLGLCMGNIDSQNNNWSLLKKVFKPLFEIKYNDACQELLVEWEVTLDKLYEKRQPVDIADLIKDLPTKCMLYIIFGKTFVIDNQHKFTELNLYAKELMGTIFSNNTYAKYYWYRFLPTKTNMTLSQFQKTWKCVIDSAYNNQYVIKEGLYHKLFNNYEKYKVCFEMFSQTLIEVIYTNQDPIVPSLAWSMVHYALYPNTLNNYAHFIEESARIEPILLASLPKKTINDIVIDGKIIKKDTIVCIDLKNIGYSPEWNMSDLDQFNPERFDKQTCFVTRFGYGGRQCPGKNLANLLLSEILKIIHRKWILIPAKNNIGVDDSRQFRMPVINLWIATKFDLSTDNTKIYCNCNPVFEKKEYGFIGISVCKTSPYLEQQKCDDLAKFIKKSTDEKFLILIADQIAYYNMKAFEDYGERKSIDKSLALGEQMFNLFSNSIARYNCGNIQLCRWNDLGIPDMSQELDRFKKLNERVTFVANQFIQYRRPKTTPKSYRKIFPLVKSYIYNELPILVCGVFYQGIHYKLLHYSGTVDHLNRFLKGKSQLPELSIDIIFENEFQDVKNLIVKKLGYDIKIPGSIGIDIHKL